VTEWWSHEDVSILGTAQHQNRFETVAVVRHISPKAWVTHCTWQKQSAMNYKAMMLSDQGKCSAVPIPWLRRKRERESHTTGSSIGSSPHQPVTGTLCCVPIVLLFSRVAHDGTTFSQRSVNNLYLRIIRREFKHNGCSNETRSRRCEEMRIIIRPRDGQQNGGVTANRNSLTRLNDSVPGAESVRTEPTRCHSVPYVRSCAAKI
jgi:hypothetical protein